MYDSKKKSLTQIASCFTFDIGDVGGIVDTLPGLKLHLKTLSGPLLGDYS